VPSLALGTGEVTLLELTAAYGAFANGGILAPAALIRRVEERDGTVIWDEPHERRRAVSPTTAFLMSSMLADVIDRGTATRVRAAGFRLPAAGKTGTTDDFVDAWFIGYTPHVVAGVWFGYDHPASIMPRGFARRVTVPAWASFMKAITAGSRPEWFEVPRDVEQVEICRLSGQRARAACRNPDPFDPLASGVYREYFASGTAPAEECWMHVDETAPVGTVGVSIPEIPATIPPFMLRPRP
jgi:penicillin-binding protein 1A